MQGDCQKSHALQTTPLPPNPRGCSYDLGRRDSRRDYNISIAMWLEPLPRNARERQQTQRTRPQSPGTHPKITENVRTHTRTCTVYGHLSRTSLRVPLPDMSIRTVYGRLRTYRLRTSLRVPFTAVTTRTGRPK